MALPVAAVAVDPASGAQSASVPVVSVAATSAASTGDPVITAREWSVGGAVAAADAVAVDVDIFAAGVYAVAVEVTNADGSNSASTNVTVTDDYTAPAFIPGQAWLGDTVERIHPESLPAEYRDGISCTPGIPTGQRIHLARELGTILPDAGRATAAVNGELVVAVPTP